MHIGRWLLRSSNIFFTTIIFFHDFIFHESEIRTVLLEVSIDLGLLKKSLLKTSKNVLMYSNSLARHFSSMFHAKCLPPRLDRLLLLRSCLQNFYQCKNDLKDSYEVSENHPRYIQESSKNHPRSKIIQELTFKDMDIGSCHDPDFQKITYFRLQNKRSHWNIWKKQ